MTVFYESRRKIRLIEGNAKCRYLIKFKTIFGARNQVGRGFVARAGIFKPLWSPGIDAKASFLPAYVAWRAGTITLFLLGA
jgi:hypothetical protein